MQDRYKKAFARYFDKLPYMVPVFKKLANEYLQNGDERFIHKCHIALISNAQDELRYDNYYRGLARAAIAAIKEREG